MTSPQTPSTTRTMQARSLIATGWSMGSIFFQRGLSLISNLIMTRLLLPEAFGLMAIIFTVHLLIEMMSDIGIRQSIVRSERGEDHTFLRVAWTVQILRSGVIAAVILVVAAVFWALAPVLEGGSTVYAHPQLPGLLAFSSLAILFRGFETVAMFVEARNLRLNKITYIEVGSQIITLMLMLGLAQIQATVWVLVIGMVCGGGLRMILTHLTFRTPRMALAWDAEIADDLWKFGRWLIGGSLAGFIVNNGDRFILGAFLDTETFGFYVIAALWLQTGAMLFNRLTDQVIYAALSETLRTARDQFLQTLRQFRFYFDLATLVSFVALFFGGAWLITFLYPESYATAGTFLTLLSFRFLARRQMPLGASLLAEGKSKDMMYSATASALAICVFVPLCYSLGGTLAAVLAVAIAPLAGSVILLIRSKQHFNDIPMRSDLIAMTAVLIGAIIYFLTSNHGIG